MNHRFWVERCWDGEWTPVAFVESNSVQYCHGWLDCVESMLPHKSYRLCKRIGPAVFKVLREVSAAGPVRTSCGRCTTSSEFDATRKPGSHWLPDDGDEDT